MGAPPATKPAPTGTYGSTICAHMLRQNTGGRVP